MSNKKIKVKDSKYQNSNPFIVGGLTSLIFWFLLLVTTHVNQDFVLLYDPTSPVPHDLGILLGNLLLLLPIAAGILFLLIGIVNHKKINDKRTSFAVLTGIVIVGVYYFLSLLLINILIHY